MPEAAPDLVIPVANVTVVRSAEELQEAALVGARDIEIRSHLDLRRLRLAVNPEISGPDNRRFNKRLALLYGTSQARSIRVRRRRPSARCQSSMYAPTASSVSVGAWSPRVLILLHVRNRICALSHYHGEVNSSRTISAVSRHMHQHSQTCTDCVAGSELAQDDRSSLACTRARLHWADLVVWNQCTCMRLVMAPVPLSGTLASGDGRYARHLRLGSVPNRL